MKNSIYVIRMYGLVWLQYTRICELCKPLARFMYGENIFISRNNINFIVY